MELKYSQFYFENQIHDYNEFWDLYDINKKRAYEIYNGKIYCPMCTLAPLDIVNGKERRYFRVSKTHMSLHANDCPYLLEVATKKEAKYFFEKASEKEICSCLQSCMNHFLRKITQPQREKKLNNNISNQAPNFLAIKTKERKSVYLPHKFLGSELSDDDLGIEKIFYGKCRLYLLKSNYYNYLKVLDEKYKEICSIKITESVYTYLPEMIKHIPDVKEDAAEYFICFIAELQKRQKGDNFFYNGTLMKSYYMLFYNC